MKADVWVAAVAGILGAVIGGAFATAAAIYQAKALFRATAHELSETFSRERRLRDEDDQLRALRESLGVVIQIEHESWLMAQTHEHEHECRYPVESMDKMGMLRAELGRCWWVYNSHSLSRDAEYHMAGLTDALHVLLGHDPTGLQSLIDNCQEPDDLANYCQFGQVAYCVEEISVKARSELVDALRQHKEITRQVPSPNLGDQSQWRRLAE